MGVGKRGASHIAVMLVGLCVLPVVGFFSKESLQERQAETLVDIESVMRGAVPREPLKSVRISFSGDILVHKAIYSKANTGNGYNFDANLNKVALATGANINICHLETVLSKQEPSTYPRFRTPESLGGALHINGFHGCSLASNHSIDYGYEGIVSTIDALDRYGVRHVGTRKSPFSSKVAVYNTDGITTAHLSYTFSTNGITLVKPWHVNMLDTRTILEDSKAAKKLADIVVVSLHFGTEYLQTPDSYQISVVRVLTKSPYIDAIVGHHAHVVQPFALVNDKPVFYGLGNLLSAQEQRYSPTGNMGVMVTLNFSIIGETAFFAGYSYLPTIVNSSNWKVEYAANFSPSKIRLLCDSIANSTSKMVGGTLEKESAKLEKNRC